MASEAFLDSNYLMALRCMASAHATGDLMQSINSGTMLQKEGHCHDVTASFLNGASSTTTSDSSVVQQESHVSQKRVQPSKRKQQQGTTQPRLPKKKKKPTIDPNKKELSDPSQTQIRNKLETRQDAFLQQQVMQQLLQQNSPSLQLQVDLKQRRTFQTAPQLPGADLKQQQLQQQKQVKEYLQQLALRRAHTPPPPLFNGSICYRRLMQYMYHLQHRPPSNDISYWRKFVAEYFAPCAKKRWCLSSCDSVGRHAVGVFPQAATDGWHCELCGSTSGRGFEATFEVLPRLNKIQFETGVTDELLFLDFPQERRLPSGLMVLEYGKAVHETVYNQFNVVREGKLRIIFTQDLKISCWEFCSKEHEEFLPRSLVLSQVNDFIRTAQQYQAAIDSGGRGRTPPDLRENCNSLLSAGCSLEKSFESQLAGDIGFPKRYIRCLQIAEIVNSMKDLMTFSCQNKIGAIESLKSFAENFSPAQAQESDSSPCGGSKCVQVHTGHQQPLSTSHCQGITNDRISKGKGGAFTTTEEAALADYGSYVKLLSPTSNQNVAGVGEPSYLYKQFNQAASSPKQFQGSQISVPDFVRNTPSSNYSASDSSIIQEHIMNLLQRTSSKNQNTGWTEREVVNSTVDNMFAATSQNLDAYSSRNRMPSDHSSSVAISTGYLGKTQNSTAASSWESSSNRSFINKGRNHLERLGRSEEYEAFRKLFENGMSEGSLGDSTSFGWKG
ncbi:Probable transcriptional regulator SLK2 [Linum perenne]